MMFLFGGIPNVYYERFFDRAKRELRDDEFTGVPLYPSAGNAYLVTEGHCRDLIAALARYVEGHPDCLNKGAGVVLIMRAWEQRSYSREFFPFALCAELKLADPIRTRGTEASIIANKYATTALAGTKILRKPVRALIVEFQDRLRRTPLLLPIRHFNSEHLDNLIAETSDAIRAAPLPHETLKAACERFNLRHPFQSNGKGGAYMNPRGVVFTAPGRNDFHGRRRSIEGGHNERCFLNARIRLGGYYADGFHYDCTRAKKNYAGLFPNCHDAVASYEGRPHLNVFPNDFIL